MHRTKLLNILATSARVYPHLDLGFGRVSTPRFRILASIDTLILDFVAYQHIDSEF